LNPKKENHSTHSILFIPKKRKVNIENLHGLIHHLNLVHPRASFLTIAEPTQFGTIECKDKTANTNNLPTNSPSHLPYDVSELVPGKDS